MRFRGQTCGWWDTDLCSNTGLSPQTGFAPTDEVALLCMELKWGPLLEEEGGSVTCMGRTAPVWPAASASMTPGRPSLGSGLLA